MLLWILEMCVDYFADPDWDGPIEMDEDFNPKSGSGKNTKPPVGPGPDPVESKAA